MNVIHEKTNGLRILFCIGNTNLKVCLTKWIYEWMEVDIIK